MSLDNKQTVATYNMHDHATGLATFIKDNVSDITQEFKPIVYMTDEEGRHVIQAKMEEVTLTDGSKVYNLVLKLEP